MLNQMLKMLAMFKPCHRAIVKMSEVAPTSPLGALAAGPAGHPAAFAKCDACKNQRSGYEIVSDSLG